MTKKEKTLYLLLALFFPLLVSAEGKRQFNEVTYTALPQLVVSNGQGVSAPFAGVHGNTLLVAGGCNFPDVPAANGGAKKFYTDIYALDLAANGARWRNVGQLSAPLAYGVSVSVPDGVVCVGGTSDGKQSVSSVFLLSLKDGKAVVEQLPALPVALDNMAGAYGDGYIYIAGGQTDGAASHKVYRMKYGRSAEGWEVLPDYPGAARVQPVAVMQNGATGAEFFLFGGFDPSSKSVLSNGLSYNPQSRTWRRTADIQPWGEAEKMALVGAAAVPSGAAHIVFFGGVNARIFAAALQQQAPDYLMHPAEWYRFNNRLLMYHTLTDSWTAKYPHPSTARAGAAVVPYKNAQGVTSWLVVNGETKPGVRSADVTSVRMTYTTSFGWLNWTVLIFYLVSMLLLGYYFMRREGSSDDFFKGGGRIPWWAAGISIFATMLSAITYMSIPAKAYATDWTYYPMQIMILVVSFPVIKYYLPFFRRLNVTTAYEYLERRFNYATRLMASLLFIVFMVARMALVLFLPSLALAAVTGIDIFICIVLMAVITIIYCTMGGVEAVVWGDVIQGIILVGGAFLAAGYLIFNTEGGVTAFVDMGSAADKFRLFDWSFDYRTATFWVVILGGLANNLISYTSDQTVIQRYLTTKDERSAARGILTNGLMSVFVTIAFFCIGAGLYTFYKTHPASLDITMTKSDAIFPFFMMSQLPAGVAGLLIAAIFAATMSTISSNINSVSTAFTVDFYKKWKPAASDRTLLRTARIAGAMSGLVGMGIAILMVTVDIQSLLDYFNTILGLLSGAIGGLFIMGIFFPRIGSAAALVGFLCGTAAVFYLNFYTPVNFLLFGFVSMTVAVVVALGLSFVWKNGKADRGLTWQTLDKSNS